MYKNVTLKQNIICFPQDRGLRQQPARSNGIGIARFWHDIALCREPARDRHRHQHQRQSIGNNIAQQHRFWRDIGEGHWSIRRAGRKTIFYFSYFSRILTPHQGQSKNSINNQSSGNGFRNSLNKSWISLTLNMWVEESNGVNVNIANITNNCNVDSGRRRRQQETRQQQETSRTEQETSTWSSIWADGVRSRSRGGRRKRAANQTTAGHHPWYETRQKCNFMFSWGKGF